MINLVKTESGRMAIECKAFIVKDLPVGQSTDILLWFDEVDGEMVLSRAWDRVESHLCSLDSLLIPKGE